MPKAKQLTVPCEDRPGTLVAADVRLAHARSPLHIRGTEEQVRGLA
jgi:hypothetical protein